MSSVSDEADLLRIALLSLSSPGEYKRYPKQSLFLSNLAIAAVDWSFNLALSDKTESLNLSISIQLYGMFAQHKKILIVLKVEP